MVAVATVNDMSGQVRTRSLPQTLDALGVALADVTEQDVSSEIAAIRELKSGVNADLVPSLKYLRHLRNKWVGHASLDRNFDDWADADTAVSLPLIEDALVRLVNAHQRLAEVVEGSEVLSRIAKETRAPLPDELPVTVPMTVDWGAVIPLALVSREWAGRAAEALVDQLRSPPGYGSKDDSDWRPGSDHDLRRRAIDDAALRSNPLT